MTSSNENIEDYSNFKVKNIPCPLRFIQGGTFTLGADKSARPITVPSFYMGQFPVTQALYEAVMETDSNPSKFKSANRPQTNINWNEARDFAQKLTSITSKPFRLPSEAEWEFAARGGIHSQGYEYAGSDDLKQVGWYDENSGNETKPVGLLLPNELGLYDMSGNVVEWCEDDWHSSDKLNENGRPLDGSAWIDGDTEEERAGDRVLRGGACFGSAGLCRPAYRNYGRPDCRYSNIGFRLVFSLQS